MCRNREFAGECGHTSTNPRSIALSSWLEPKHQARTARNERRATVKRSLTTNKVLNHKPAMTPFFCEILTAQLTSSVTRESHSFVMRSTEFKKIPPGPLALYLPLQKDCTVYARVQGIEDDLPGSFGHEGIQ